MAKKTTNKNWKGLIINPYAKITSRTVSDEMVENEIVINTKTGEEEVIPCTPFKRYTVSYNVVVYTSDSKEWIAYTSSYRFYTLSDNNDLKKCYDDLSVNLKDWIDC